MIKKLQSKFISITMLSLFFILLLLGSAINITNFFQMNSNLDNTIKFISVNQGKIPDYDNRQMPKDIPGFKVNGETQYVTRYFYAYLDEDGNINMESINTNNIKEVTSEEALIYAEKAVNSGKHSGYSGDYRYRVIQQSDGYMLVFLYSHMELQRSSDLLVITGLVSLGTFLLMFLLVTVLSRKAIKPMIEGAEKQKQFITDAGHEIKTPLAIISANADVLELTGGGSEWINSIRNQTSRLDKLVKNLLILSKMDEDNLKITFREFKLSETVERTAEAFAVVAEAKNKKFSWDIAPDKKLFGDEDSIEKLVSTLVDNALKYSNDEGDIRLTLSQSKKGIKLEVYNTADEIDTSNLDRLFDRFYRVDSSRSRETGGYGIGLSIAKSIVEAHHGKISAKSEDGRSICITVII
jgi:two-component system, OmpR family, sensor histidine kinase CiaH